MEEEQNQILQREFSRGNDGSIPRNRRFGRYLCRFLLLKMLRAVAHVHGLLLLLELETAGGYSGTLGSLIPHAVFPGSRTTQSWKLS